MKTIVVGLPYFAKKIAFGLATTNVNDTYLAIDASAGAWEKLRYLWHILFADVLYLIGGSTHCGMTLRLAMLLNKPIVMHWVGTDVILAAKAYGANAVDAALILKAKHLCEVEWIQRELLEIGIHAQIAQIACFEDEIPAPMELPESFSILSYLGAGREKFYGMDKLIELAHAFPHIQIRIAGISKYAESLPPNMQLLGWVQHMDSEYRACTLYLRLAEHDGLAFSVLEALAHGRYVGYTYSFPHVDRVENFENLHALVTNLLERFKANTLKTNLDGFRFISIEYGRTKIMRLLSEVLKSHTYPSAAA